MNFSILAAAFCDIRLLTWKHFCQGVTQRLPGYKILNKQYYESFPYLSTRIEFKVYHLGVGKSDSPRSPLLAFQFPKTLDFTGFLTNVSVRISQ